MVELILTDVSEVVLHQLQARATSHGRTPEDEAKAILSEVLRGKGQGVWTQVDAIYSRLAASGGRAAGTVRRSAPPSAASRRARPP